MQSVSAMNTLRFDVEKCNGCGMCLFVCPHAVFVKTDGKVSPDGSDACMECGACMINCPAGALLVDSGVGCAYAMMRDALTGKGVSCGCGG